MKQIWHWKIVAKQLSCLIVVLVLWGFIIGVLVHPIWLSVLIGGLTGGVMGWFAGSLLNKVFGQPYTYEQN